MIVKIVSFNKKKVIQTFYCEHMPVGKQWPFQAIKKRCSFSSDKVFEEKGI